MVLVSRLGRGGFTLVELVLSIAVLSVLVGVSVPLAGSVLDEQRAAAAARYVAARIVSARIEAVMRSSAVGLRFQAVSGDYTFGSYLDGNGNGLRASEIETRIDVPLGTTERLADNFPGVRFELLPDVPDADGARDGRTDGVRIGVSRILTLSPDGTATSGTLYVRGRRSQYAVRVLGGTGRTRVLQYHTGERKWISR